MRNLALVSLLVVLIGTTASAQKIKAIVDQDARGPGTSHQQALLVFLQSDEFDVLGITTVSGDQWVILQKFPWELTFTRARPPKTQSTG